MKKGKIFLPILILLFTFSGCGEKKNSVQIGDEPTNNDVVIQATDEMLLKNGQTDYAIVIPENSGVVTKFAAEELQLFFEEATNVRLRILTDKDKTWSAESKYISIGHTAFIDEAGVSTQGKELGTSGFMMETEGDSVFILGDDEYANAYGVYSFLNSILNYEFYCEDCYSLDKNVKDIPIYDYSIVDIPDIEYRCAAYGWAQVDQENLMRYRQREFFDLFIRINGQPFHNSVEYIPPEKYKATHPKWFATSGEQLSYTAQGDPEEYALLVQTVADVMKENIISQPDKHIITLTIMDEPTFDASPASLALKEKYGADSASIILFLNDVNKVIREWFQSEDGKPYERELEILFFAYMKAEEAPVVWNEEKQAYEGKEGIRCDDGVSVFYAPIHIDYLSNINDPINSTYSDTISQWASISDNIFLWTYNGNFKDYMLPYDTFNGIGDIYKKAAESGVRWMLNQSQFETTTVASGFSALKQYLDSKLAWDSTLNVNTLIENFMDNYYGEASEGVKNNFNSFRAHSEWVKNNCSGYAESFSCESYLLQSEYWPKQTLIGWYNQLNAAIDDIEYLKTVNPERYDVLYKRVANERLSWLYMLIELYGYNTSPETLMSWKQQFKADHELIGGGTRGGAGGVGEDFIPGLFEKWGI